MTDVGQVRDGSGRPLACQGNCNFILMGSFPLPQRGNRQRPIYRTATQGDFRFCNETHIGAAVWALSCVATNGVART